MYPDVVFAASFETRSSICVLALVPWGQWWKGAVFRNEATSEAGGHHTSEVYIQGRRNVRIIVIEDNGHNL